MILWKAAFAQPGIRIVAAVVALAACLWAGGQALAVVCYQSCIETRKTREFSHSTDDPDPTRNVILWVYTVTQYEYNLAADDVWDPAPWSADLDNSFSGGKKDPKEFKGPEGWNPCNCAEFPSTGGDDVPGDYRPSTYYQYCNHCGT